MDLPPTCCKLSPSLRTRKVTRQMSPSGAIGEIALTFPGNQERTLTTISSQLHIIKLPNVYLQLQAEMLTWWQSPLLVVPSPSLYPALPVRCHLQLQTPPSSWPPLRVSWMWAVTIQTMSDNMLQCYNVTMLQGLMFSSTPHTNSD